MGACLALLLFVVVIRTAGLDLIRELLGASRASIICAAGAVTGLTLLFRGLRLVFLLPPKRLPVISAVWIAAGAGFAAIFIPARLGELVLPWLLHRINGWEKMLGLTTLIAARLLDLAAQAVVMVQRGPGDGRGNRGQPVRKVVAVARGDAVLVGDALPVAP